MKKYIYIVAILILALFANNELSAQMSGLSVNAGLSNIWIVGDNPATKPLFERDTNKPFIYGGGLGIANSGISVKFNYVLDKNENWVLPIGLDYFFFESRERIPITSKVTAYWKHYFDMPQASVGINYNVLKFPGVDVKAFVGLDAKFNYIMQGKFIRRFEYVVNDFTEVKELNTKIDAFRIGALFYVGFDGAIVKPLFINASFGVGALNLVGRDDSRKELMTPLKSFESGESIVYNTQFYLTLKYKF